MKYLLIFNIKIIGNEDGVSVEYTVDCAPSELENKITEKKKYNENYFESGLRKSGSYDSEVNVTLVQVLVSSNMK